MIYDLLMHKPHF